MKTTTERFHIMRGSEVIAAGFDTQDQAQRSARRYLETNPKADGFGEPIEVINGSREILGAWYVAEDGKPTWAKGGMA